MITDIVAATRVVVGLPGVPALAAKA